LIHDLIKPPKFNCVTAVSRGILTCLAAVSRGIYQIHRGICQILPRKTVGPSNYRHKYSHQLGTLKVKTNRYEIFNF